MKKVLISIMLIVFGMNIQGYAQKFSGYVEEPHIFNVGNSAGNLYSMGANLSFGVEYSNRMYVGGGISMYYLNCLYYYNGYYDYYWGTGSSYAMDFFADIKYKILPTKVTPIVGCKVGFGFTEAIREMNIVTRPSIGCLFKLCGRHELMVNMEYIPAALYKLHGVAINVGYKF